MSMSTADFARAKELIAKRKIPDGIADDVASMLSYRVRELEADVATLDANTELAPHWTASARLDFARRIELLNLLIEELSQ